MDYFKQYFTERFDADGVLCALSINCPQQFNYGYDIVDFIAEKEPNRRALLWCNPAGETRTITFGELAARSNQAANALLSLGVKKGDKVMLILKRHYQYWHTILGLHKIGAIAIPATNQLTVKDIEYRLQAADVSAVICTPDGVVADFLETAIDNLGQPVLKMIVKGERPGFIDFDAAVAAASPALERISNDKHDPMLLYFTSGTTAYPKMVLHDYSYPLAHYLTAKYWQNVDPDGVHITISDTGWAKASWGKLYGQWIVGTTVFVYDYDRFDASEFVGLIEKHKLTSVCAPPTILRYFAKTGLERYDLSAVKYATTAGEALNAEIYKIFWETQHIKLMEGFGQTETVLCIGNLVGSKNKIGSLGKPVPLYDVQLIDDNCRPVKPGEVGEIAIKRKHGENIGMMQCYYKSAEQTAEAFAGGYYHTGDTAYADQDGYFWYVGRKDDIIKSSGYRIGPFEIESVLMEHPAVLEVAVTAVPDEERGNIVKATIILTDAYLPDDALIAELQQFVKARTAPYKYPRIIEFVDTLPKTISGKIRRVEIRKQDHVAVIGQK